MLRFDANFLGGVGIYPSAIQAVLPRLLLAAAPPGSEAQENRRQCLKARDSHLLSSTEIQKKKAVIITDVTVCFWAFGLQFLLPFTM